VRAVLLAAVLVLSSQLAHADRGATFIDDDAAVVARIDVGPLYQLLDLGARAGGDLANLTAILGTASRFKLGHNLLTHKGYRQAGFDERRPIWLQLGAIDKRKVEGAFAHLATAHDWTNKTLRKSPKAVWRSRLIIPIRNRKRAQQTLAKLLGAVATMEPVSSKSGERLAVLVGERPRKSAEVVARLRRAKVTYIGWAQPLDAYLALRVVRGYAVIEVVGTFAGVPLVWARDRKKLLGGMAPIRRRKGGFSVRTRNRRALTQPGVHLWIGSANSTTAMMAIGLTDRLRTIAAHLPQSKARGQRAGKREPDCVALEALGEKGQVRELLVSIRPHKRRLELDFGWLLRKVDWVQAMHRPGNEIAAPGADKSVATATAFLGHGDRLAKLWRPAPLARGLASGLRALVACPGGSFSLFALLRWPELAAAFVADLRATNPTAKRITEHLHSPALAIKVPANPSRESGIMAFDAALADNEARQEAAELFVQAFGASRKGDGYRLWGNGRYTPFARDERVGFALGPESAAWYSKLPAGKPSKSLARAWIDVPGLIAPLARSIPQLEGLARLARTSLGKANLDLRLDGHVLRATAVIEVQ
jgi:hypothetical protein